MVAKTLFVNETIRAAALLNLIAIADFRTVNAFEKTYRRHSIVEPVFSSFKCRFTAVIRARTLPTQRLQLLLRCACYNLLS